MTEEAACAFRASIKKDGKVFVFTNGCFDILHQGHVKYLQFAREQGDVLCVGLNSDESVKSNKGPKRPINTEAGRAIVIAALESVDCVVLFNEKEPLNLISKLLPDVLIKGRDWAHYVCGREIVEQHGGCVKLADLVEGFSTTDLIKKIINSYE